MKSKGKETKETKETKDKNGLSVCLVANKLRSEFWQWYNATLPPLPEGASEEAKARHKWQEETRSKMVEAVWAAQAGDIFPLTRWVAEVLEPCGVRDVHGVLHDRDEEAGRKVEVHATILIRFVADKKTRAQRTLAAIARRLGIGEGRIQKPPPGRYGPDNLTSYPCHIKYSEKYQYPVEDFASVVITPDGETYAQIYAARYEDWMNGRGKVKAKQAENAVEYIVEQILDGEITRQQIFLDRKLLGVYARHRSQIDDALFAYGQSKFEQARRDVAANNWRMVVVFVSGKAGYGKSVFAKYLAENLDVWFYNTTGKHWQYFDAAATHSLDNYNCEEIIIMDDLSARSLSAADWKRLFDNHTTQTIAARYHDATPICRVLVLTNTHTPHNFFAPIAISNDEDLGQYIRRITAWGKVVKSIERDAGGKVNLSTVVLRLAFPQRVEPYYYGSNEIPLEYEFTGEEKDYSAESASYRLLGMVEKAQLPEPQPYPEDWKKRLLSMSREQLIAQTEEAEAREAAAVSLPAPPADDGETVEAIDLPF